MSATDAEYRPPVPVLQMEMAFWEGYGVAVEWFTSADGTSALGVFGSPLTGDDFQILSIHVDTASGQVATTCTDAVEFSTGGPEF